MVYWSVLKPDPSFAIMFNLQLINTISFLNIIFPVVPYQVYRRQSGIPHQVKYFVVIGNICVKCCKKIFIGDEDIQSDRPNFQIICQFEQTKIMISWSFLICLFRNLAEGKARKRFEQNLKFVQHLPGTFDFSKFLFSNIVNLSKQKWQ